MSAAIRKDIPVLNDDEKFFESELTNVEVSEMKSNVECGNRDAAADVVLEGGPDRSSGDKYSSNNDLDPLPIITCDVCLIDSSHDNEPHLSRVSIDSVQSVSLGPVVKETNSNACSAKTDKPVEQVPKEPNADEEPSDDVTNVVEALITSLAKTDEILIVETDEILIVEQQPVTNGACSERGCRVGYMPDDDLLGYDENEVLGTDGPFQSKEHGDTDESFNSDAILGVDGSWEDGPFHVIDEFYDDAESEREDLPPTLEVVAEFGEATGENSGSPLVERRCQLLEHSSVTLCSESPVGCHVLLKSPPTPLLDENTDDVGDCCDLDESMYPASLYAEVLKKSTFAATLEEVKCGQRERDLALDDQPPSKRQKVSTTEEPTDVFGDSKRETARDTSPCGDFGEANIGNDSGYHSLPETPVAVTRAVVSEGFAASSKPIGLLVTVRNSHPRQQQQQQQELPEDVGGVVVRSSKEFVVENSNHSSASVDEPRRPLASVSIEENRDNEDPQWEYLRKLNTDTERYRAVRQHWKNLNIPNPNRNLTRQNYRKGGHRAIQEDGRRFEGTCGGGGGKRNFADPWLPPAKRQRQNLGSTCSGLFDNRISQIGMNYELERRALNLEKFNKVDQVRCSFARAREMLAGRQHYGHPMPDNDGQWHHLVDMEMQEIGRVNDLYDSRLRKLDENHENNVDKLMECREEILNIQAFYCGLKNSDNDPVDMVNVLTDRQLLEIEETDRFYRMLGIVYRM